MNILRYAASAAAVAAAFLVAEPALARQAAHEPQAGHQHEHAREHPGVGHPGNARDVTRTVTIDMNDSMRFNPSAITVKRGDVIRFVVSNSGKLKHELVIGSVSELKEHAALMQKFPGMEHDEPNQVAVEPGKRGTLIWRFDAPGKVDFACLQPGHFEAGMRGSVVVSAK